MREIPELPNDLQINLEATLSTMFRGGNDRVVGSHDFTRLISDFFTTHLINKPKLDAPTLSNVKEYTENELYWKDILSMALRPGMPVNLNHFHLTEWTPLSPGTYFTDNARSSRERAQRYISKERDEYLPIGKEYLVLGGVGSVRLLPREFLSNRIYFLSASSSGVCHQGIPIITHESEYRKVINDIVDTGGCVANIEGKIVESDRSGELVKCERSVPRYSFFAETISPIRKSKPNELLTTVAIMFPSGYHSAKGTEIEYNGYKTRLKKSWTFYSFRPAKRQRNLETAVDWLIDYAERYSGLYNPPILSDFDEHIQHFPNPIEFPVRDVANRKIDLKLLNIYGDFHDFHVDEQIIKKKSQNNVSHSNIGREMSESDGWPERKKWFMGIASALIVALIIYLFGLLKTPHQFYGEIDLRDEYYLYISYYELEEAQQKQERLRELSRISLEIADLPPNVFMRSSNVRIGYGEDQVILARSPTTKGKFLIGLDLLGGQSEPDSVKREAEKLRQIISNRLINIEHEPVGLDPKFKEEFDRMKKLAFELNKDLENANVRFYSRTEYRTTYGNDIPD
jgi:hypothetical protein